MGLDTGFDILSPTRPSAQRGNNKKTATGLPMAALDSRE